MANFTFDDNYAKDLAKTMGDNLEKAAIYLKEKVVMEINRSQPRKRTKSKSGIHYKGLNPSEPGTPPKKLTGFLQRSIAYEMSQDRTQSYVGTNTKYGAILELGSSKMKPRPYLRPTLLREQENIGKIVATGRL